MIYGCDFHFFRPLLRRFACIRRFACTRGHNQERVRHKFRNKWQVLGLLCDQQKDVGHEVQLEEQMRCLLRLRWWVLPMLSRASHRDLFCRNAYVSFNSIIIRIIIMPYHIIPYPILSYHTISYHIIFLSSPHYYVTRLCE